MGGLGVEGERVKRGGRRGCGVDLILSTKFE